MRKEMIHLTTRGFTKSFYISRHDIDFYLALASMLESKDMNISTFVMSCLKYVVLNEGSEFFTNFKDHYKKVIEERLEEMPVKYKGQIIKLGELVESELLKESGFIKI